MAHQAHQVMPFSHQFTYFHINSHHQLHRYDNMDRSLHSVPRGSFGDMHAQMSLLFFHIVSRIQLKGSGPRDVVDYIQFVFRRGLRQGGTRCSAAAAEETARTTPQKTIDIAAG